MRWIARRPAVEDFTRRGRDGVRVLSAAQTAAYSAQGDHEALQALLRAVDDDEEGLQLALFMARPATDYITDRVLRLLRAAAGDGRVKPIAAASEELYLREQELGRLPLQAAFDRLAQSEPRLRELEADVRDDDWRSTMKLSDELIRRRTEDGELITTPLVMQLLNQYFNIASGVIDGDLRVPFFAAPRVLKIDGLGRPDRRES